jgi:hypothetical protein
VEPPPPLMNLAINFEFHVGTKSALEADPRLPPEEQHNALTTLSGFSV